MSIIKQKKHKFAHNKIKKMLIPRNLGKGAFRE